MPLCGVFGDDPMPARIRAAQYSYVYGVIRYEPKMDKVMRKNTVTSMIENGFVLLPKEAHSR